MKIDFVVVSKDDKFLMLSYDYRYIIENNIGRVTTIANNTEALSKVYNRYLDNIRNKKEDIDYIVFLHSDVKFNIEDFINHLQSVNGKYDLIGFCGTSQMNISQSPLNWFTSSRQNPQSRWGCVTHEEIGNKTSYFSSHSPDIFDHEVSCIDGLCIIFNKKMILSDIRFDESLGKFDFYDSDISLQAFINYKFKIGVIVQKDLIHTSVGQSITKEKFLVEEIKFRRKWLLPMTEQLIQLEQKIKELSL